MSVFSSDGPAEPALEQPTAAVSTATEEKPSQPSAHDDKASSDKRSIDNSPFHYQFGEVEKAIANFTKHQPFNHHYAPNVNVNNRHHHHNNNHNNHHHYNNNNRGNHHNGNHHNHNNHYNNGHYNNNGSSNNNRLQPQTFTMNAQLKQQQQQQFLSSAAQQINNRYKSNNGGMNQMANVNGMSSVNHAPQMGQVNGMPNMSGMNQMVNGMSGMVNTMQPQVTQQTQGYIPPQYQQQSMAQQQLPQQQHGMPLGNGFMANDLKFDAYSQQPQPQLTHSDYITPLRNSSPQFAAPTRPVSVSAFSSPLEQINSNSSFGLNAADMQSPMTNASSTGVIDGDYEKKLSLGDSTYLGDIWGSAKGLRNSTSVWA